MRKFPLIVMLLIAGAAGSATHGFWYQIEELEREAERPRVTKVEWDVDRGGKLITVEHEGHLWVVYTKGGLSHHPGCQRCLDHVLGKQGPTEEERKFWQLEKDKPRR